MSEKAFGQEHNDAYFWGKEQGLLQEEDGPSQVVTTNRLRHKYLRQPTDMIIEKNVLHELGGDPDIAHNKISVLVNSGVVKLIGTVNAYWERMSAEEDAYKVRGVFDVKNELTIS